jgi:peptide/nickel transport system substrate-binding protein
MLESVVAVDSRTVRFRWTQTYAAADDLQAGDFAPLPRHVLEAPFQQREPDAFVAHPFWMSDYVGAGPYRVRQIELGTFIGGEAFERFVLGRPKINSIRLVPITDANTVLANLLAGSAHAATDNTIDLQQAVVLEREWSSRGGSVGGVVIRSPIGVRFSNFQLRPEYAHPRSLTDVRVRKAVAHSTDRQSLADGTLEGLTTAADAIVLREVEYFPALDRVSAKYPLDRQRASQLMSEAGWALGPDGIYANPTEGRFTLELRTVEGARNSAEFAIMADGLRQMGIDATIRALSRPERTADPMLVGNFPGIFTGHNTHAVDPPLEWFRADEIIRVETRGRGSNYSGFNHPEVERLVRAFETTLDRNQREQQLVQALKIVSEEVPLFPLYYSLGFVAHAANIRGPVMGVSREVATWNLHEWQWTS